MLDNSLPVTGGDKKSKDAFMKVIINKETT